MMSDYAQLLVDSIVKLEDIIKELKKEARTFGGQVPVSRKCIDSVLKSFIASGCIVDNNHSEVFGEFYKIFRRYCLTNNLPISNKNSISRGLKQFGCKSAIVKQQRGIIGISLKPTI